MKKILFAIAMILSVSAFAEIDFRQIDAAGFNKLTDVQKLAVIKSVAEQAAVAQAPMSEATIDKIDRWSQVGANLGKGLAATAKELGVAVNDFANTPIGKVATFLIIWHIMGSAIVHIVGAIGIWIFGVVAIRYVVSWTYPTRITYDETKTNKFGNYPVKAVDRQGFGGEMAFGVMIAYAVVAGAGAVMLFTI